MLFPLVGREARRAVENEALDWSRGVIRGGACLRSSDDDDFRAQSMTGR